MDGVCTGQCTRQVYQTAWAGMPKMAETVARIGVLDGVDLYDRHVARRWV